MSSSELLIKVGYIDALMDGIKFTLMFGGLFFTMIGLFSFFHLLKGPREPADTSNRINRIRLWWFALTRPDKFVDTFPWLKNDEWENVNPEPVPDYGLFANHEDGILASDELLHCCSITRIIVPSSLAKDQLLKASRYIHDRKDLDTNLVMVNTLAHIHQNPDLIEVEKE